MRKPTNKKVLACALVVHSVVTAVTWASLRRSAPGQVRGNKKGWKAASGLNTLGSAAYWLVGRRRPNDQQ